MPVPPSFSHSVMAANPRNLGESSSWAENQASEVRERPIYTFSGVFVTLLTVVYQLFHKMQMDAILERFGMLESVRRRFKEEKVG